MEIAGLPLHPLVVHAVVVLAPIAALVAITYAAMPRWRWALRELLLGLTIVAVVTGVLATQSGDALLESRPALRASPSVQDHIDAGTNLRNVLLGFTVLAFAAAFRLGGPSALTSGRGARPERPRNLIDLALIVLLLVASLAVLVTAFMAGHSGAVAVWG